MIFLDYSYLKNLLRAIADLVLVTKFLSKIELHIN